MHLDIIYKENIKIRKDRDFSFRKYGWKVRDLYIVYWRCNGKVLKKVQ